MPNPRSGGCRSLQRVKRLELCFLAMVVTFTGQVLWVSRSLHQMDVSPTSHIVSKPEEHYSFRESKRSLNGPRSRVEKGATGGTPEIWATHEDPLNSESLLRPPRKKKHTKWITHEKKNPRKISANKTKKIEKKEKTSKSKDPLAENLRFNPEKEGRQREAPLPLKVGKPVFVASLPKSGTTSVFQYFNCGGYRASHQWVKYNDTDNEQSGKCIRRNVHGGLPPFQNCGSSDIFTDTGFAVYLSGGKLPNIPTDCYYPSIQALDAIYEHYPHSTIVNVVRNASSWIESMLHWGKGSLLKRWMLCDVPGLPRWHAKKEEFIEFYEWHNDRIRNFTASHPTITYVEVQLESLDAGRVLEEAIGIPSQCWGKCSPDSVFCERLQ